MERADPFRRGLTSANAFGIRWRWVSIFFSIVVLVWLLAVFGAGFRRLDIFAVLLLTVALALGAVVFLHFRFLLRAHEEHKESEKRFQQMAGNIQEIFWMMDAATKKLLYVNEAYETITGRSRRSLADDPTCYEDLIHSEDRPWVLVKLHEAIRSGRFDERFRIACSNEKVRWVRVRGFPVRDADDRIYRLVGTAQEITLQKQAEEHVAQNLALAESARAEADALSRATLALTQNLQVDYVLDTLLQCLADLIPCECVEVLLLEADTHLFLARENRYARSISPNLTEPVTLDVAGFPLLRRVLTSRESILLRDTKVTQQWQPFHGHTATRSWLCVPLLASQQTLGILSIGHAEPDVFTSEHLRRAELLAIPAAVAIQNARLYERAEIYGAELESRIADLRHVREALAKAKGEHRDS
jgi:PAS domain S-box-containing protein